MADYSLDEARERLPDLVARARAGEEVVLTAAGTVVAEVKARAAFPRSGRPMVQADWDWLLARRGRMTSNGVEAAAFVRAMRDEDWA